MAYRRTQSVEKRLADKHARILRAARSLVAEGGFREAQVAAVAAVADVATGTVYRYFPSKAELFAEVLRMTSQREVDVASQIAASEGPASLRVVDAVRAFAGRAIRGRRLAYALIAEPVDPEIDSARLEYRRALGKVFEAMIAEGIETGEFAPQNVEASAACLVGALIEGLVGPLAPDSDAVERESEALVEAIVAFCLRALSNGKTVNGEQ
jgi:AcrR family transcriptional regulator